MTPDQPNIAEAISRVQREVHEGLQRVLDRLHKLELFVTLQLGKTESELRAEINKLRADTDQKFADLALNNAHSKAASYKWVITTALSVGAAVGAMAIEFGMKRYGG